MLLFWAISCSNSCRHGFAEFYVDTGNLMSTFHFWGGAQQNQEGGNRVVTTKWTAVRRKKNSSAGRETPGNRYGWWVWITLSWFWATQVIQKPQSRRRGWTFVLLIPLTRWFALNGISRSKVQPLPTWLRLLHDLCSSEPTKGDPYSSTITFPGRFPACWRVFFLRTAVHLVVPTFLILLTCEPDCYRPLKNQTINLKRVEMFCPPQNKIDHGLGTWGNSKGYSLIALALYVVVVGAVVPCSVSLMFSQRSPGLLKY